MKSNEVDNQGKTHPPTTSSKRYVDNDGVSWSNYQGSKGAHNLEATQLNSKTKDGMHSFYSPMSGIQGVAFDERKKFEEIDKEEVEETEDKIEQNGDDEIVDASDMENFSEAIEDSSNEGIELCDEDDSSYEELEIDVDDEDIDSADIEDDNYEEVEELIEDDFEDYESTEIF